MVETVREKSDQPPSYQQALDEFGITQLLSHLKHYGDADFNAESMDIEEPELKTLATVLIQHLTENLTGKLIASYLNTIRQVDSDLLFDPIKTEIAPPSIDPPATWNPTTTPRYQTGSPIRWRPLNGQMDWGVVIGFFYAYARHQCQWAICYLIWLDKDSPSAAWIVADTAWEEDIEPRHPKGTLTTKYKDSYSWTCTEAVGPRNYLKSPNVLRTPSGRYRFDDQYRTPPRTLTQREQDLIELYSNCQLGMTPRQFYHKWDVNYEQIASICSRSTATVQRWFSSGHNYRRPQPIDLRHLALMDFLLEHFEEIPQVIRNLLCPYHQEQIGDG